MLKVLLFILVVVAFIMGGAMVLLETAKKPKLPKGIKTPEDWDKEDEDWKS